MARHRLSRDQVIWSFGPDLEPVLEIEPGDVVTFETNDCFSGQIRLGQVSDRGHRGVDFALRRVVVR